VIGAEKGGADSSRCRYIPGRPREEGRAGFQYSRRYSLESLIKAAGSDCLYGQRAVCMGVKSKDDQQATGSLRGGS